MAKTKRVVRSVSRPKPVYAGKVIRKQSRNSGRMASTRKTGGCTNCG